MEARNLLAPLVAGLLLVLLVVVDWMPALHGAPLLFMVLTAAIQIDRELAAALARREVYPSAPVMNFLTAIVVLHIAYFRSPAGSTFLELVNTVVVAMFTLVVVAAVSAEVKERGLGQTVRHGLLAWAIPLVAGGGLGAALLVQTIFEQRVTPQGSALAAILLAAAWVGLGFGRRADRAREGYPAPTAAGRLVRLLVPAVLVTIGLASSGLAAELPVARAVVVGLGLGLGCLLGYEGVRALAGHCQIDTFRAGLPHQVSSLQPVYNRLFSGGLTDYAAAMIPAWPIAWLLLRWALP